MLNQLWWRYIFWIVENDWNSKIKNKRGIQIDMEHINKASLCFYFVEFADAVEVKIERCKGKGMVVILKTTSIL